MENYRYKLKVLLRNIFHRFPFNLVAISCYTSYNYVNSVEIAFFIKKYINPNCIIVVGGVHATLIPDDFQQGNFPEYIYNDYDKNITPFDFLIKEEGEISFFELIKKLLTKSIEVRKNKYEPCRILGPIIVENLNILPIIDLKLLEKYKEWFKKYNNFYLDFSRGCPFRCKICPTSENYIISYKKMRYRAFEKCFEELKIINNTSWLSSLKTLFIVDLTFLPRPSKRLKFYEKFSAFLKKEGNLNFNLYVNERVDLISENDIKKYKEFNIIPLIGLESGSKTILINIGKVIRSKIYPIQERAKKFLEKVEDIIKSINKHDLPAIFYYMIGLPGSNEKTLKESERFFFEKRFEGKTLMDKFKINLSFSKYAALYGSEIYTNAEKEHNSIIYFKEWWKLFVENQPIYAAMVGINSQLDLIEFLKLNFNFIKKIFKCQRKQRNSFYSIEKLMLLKKELNKLESIYTNYFNNQ